MIDRSGFDEFATARTKRLFHYAYLVCGDWHEAQDLVQTTLAKLYVAWRRIERQENVDAYARRVLLRSYLSHRRLRPTLEVKRCAGDIADPRRPCGVAGGLRLFRRNPGWRVVGHDRWSRANAGNNWGVECNGEPTPLAADPARHDVP